MNIKARLTLRASLLILGMLLLCADVRGETACTSDECKTSCDNLVIKLDWIEKNVKNSELFSATHAKCDFSTPQDLAGPLESKGPGQCECYNKNGDKLALFRITKPPRVVNFTLVYDCEVDADCTSRCQHLVVHDKINKIEHGNAASKDRSKCVSSRCTCHDSSGNKLAHFETSK